MAAPLRRGVFLDRDGTIIEDRHYLAEPEGVTLLPGAAEAIARLNRAGIPVIVVTNQSGIGRGYFGEPEYRAVARRMTELLERAGARVDASYHCPHAPDRSPPCDCRKPADGLFVRAAEAHQLDLDRSWYVGDRLRDLAAGTRRGAPGYLIGGDAELADSPPGVRVVRDLAEAVESLMRDRDFD